MAVVNSLFGPYRVMRWLATEASFPPAPWLSSNEDECGFCDVRTPNSPNKGNATHFSSAAFNLAGLNGKKKPQKLLHSRKFTDISARYHLNVDVAWCKVTVLPTKYDAPAVYIVLIAATVRASAPNNQQNNF